LKEKVLASGTTATNISINTNPYQGLKVVASNQQIVFDWISINTNPYQGLKVSYTGGGSN
jgi:hypothetical protein